MSPLRVTLGGQQCVAVAVMTVVWHTGARDSLLGTVSMALEQCDS